MAKVAVSPLQVMAQVKVPGAATLPGPEWVASFDARGPVTVSAGASAFLTLPRGGPWHHVEATRSALWVDGRSLSVRPGAGPVLRFSGPGDVRALIISAPADRPALLLHRLAELHARMSMHAFPVGADLGDRIHYGSRYWTSGFWAGALWHAGAIAPLFSQWALPATVAHFGQERSDTHDVGFEYGESSLAAWQALCRRPGAPPVCGALMRSALAAAGELVALERTNERAGTVPTSSRSGDTIVDSMMNVALLLPWASRLTGDPLYARIALRHARRVAALLVRPDGSTIQSVNFNRATGRVLFRSTHQGLSAASTWARGQGWAVYGFSVAASELHDRGLLRVAVRAASYVARHLAAGGVPRWDYDAARGAPVDVSAGVITAAGMLHLAAACRSLRGACADPGQWSALGRRMLDAALARVSATPPLGFLGGQILNQRARGCWCNGGELIFGLTYALEALNLSR